MTAPTNGQSSTGYTNEPHYLPRRFHTQRIQGSLQGNNVSHGALERVSTGPAAGQVVYRAQRAQRQWGSEYKGQGNGNSFRRWQSIGGHSVTQELRCFEAITTPSTTGPSGFLYHKPVPNSFSRGALAPWHKGTSVATCLGQMRHRGDAHDNSFCRSN